MNRWLHFLCITCFRERPCVSYSTTKKPSLSPWRQTLEEKLLCGAKICTYRQVRGNSRGHQIKKWSNYRVKNKHAVMGNPWSSRQTKAQPKPQSKHKISNKQPSKERYRICANRVDENLVFKDVWIKVFKWESESGAVLAAWDYASQHARARQWVNFLNAHEARKNSGQKRQGNLKRDKKKEHFKRSSVLILPPTGVADWDPERLSPMVGRKGGAEARGGGTAD